MRTILLALATVAATTSVAQAECKLGSVNVMSAALNLSYDPFDANPFERDIPVRLRGGLSCADARVELAIIPDSPFGGARNSLIATSGASTLTFEIDTQAGAARVVNLAADAFATRSAAGRLSGSGDDVQGRLLTLLIPSGQLSSPGVYQMQGRLVMRAVDRDGVASDPVEAPFSLTINVQPSFRLAAGSGMTLDLGELEAGSQSPPVTFNAFSNVGYVLNVKSDNDWRLGLNGKADSASTAVPYEVQLSDRTVRRSRGGNAVTFDEPHGDGVRHHSLRARVLDFNPAPAGVYRDWVTVEISPRIS